MNHIELGKKGEALACSFLLDAGYEIVTRNYRCKIGEIDIIAKDHGTLLFIEVKSRHNVNFGTAAEAVNAKKRRKIRLIALTYLQSCGLKDQDIRFDIIEVYFPYQESAKIYHITNAFGEN